MQTLKKQNGMGILQVIIVTALLIIASMAMIEVFNRQRKMVAQKHAIATMSQLLLNIQANLTSREAWDKIVELNDSLDCLKPGSAAECISTGDKIQVVTALYPGTGKPYIDTAPTAGFTIRGQPCDGFDATDGNDECPIRAEVTWRPDCNIVIPPAVVPVMLPQGPFCCGGPSACGSPMKPDSMVAIEFIFKPGTGSSIILNASRFNVPFTSRTAFATDAAVTDCGLDGMVFIGKGEHSPNLSYQVDPRGCLPAAALRRP